MKKTILLSTAIASIVIFSIFLQQVAGDALDADCQIKPICDVAAGEINVLSLEQPTNSMAGLYDQYPNKVCCNGPMLQFDPDCNDPNTGIFIKLDKDRNSHAQYWTFPNYARSQCMSSFTSFGCFIENACSPGFKCVVDISMNRGVASNAHLASCNTPGNYQRICCGTTSVCGNSIVEPGEECDPGLPDDNSDDAPDNFAHILDCTYMDTFNDPDPDLRACGPTSCFINTTNCTKAAPQIPICGDGIIDINETCDGNNWGPVVDGCWWFDSFTGGNLSCFPLEPVGGYGPNPGDPIQCHFNTTACLPGFYPTPMICGRTTHDNLPISNILTVACNDTIYNRQPFYSCPGEYDCMYLNETDSTVPPLIRCLPDGGEYHNMAGQPIVCHGKKSDGITRLNTWCPKYFTWDEATETCIFTEPVQDSGNMSAWIYNDYQANCSLPISQMTSNYTLGKQCLEPDDNDGPPDDMYPKTDVVCRNFTIANYNNTYNPLRLYGFYHDREAIVY